MPTSTSPERSRADPRSLCGCTAGTAAIVGAVLVLLGSWFVADLSKDLSGPPYGSDPSSGWSAVWLGDLDGDRVTDLALHTAFEHAPGGTDEWGVIRVLSGATGTTLGEMRDTGEGWLHELVGPAGDVDGDGRPETWWKNGDQELLVGKAGEERVHLRLEVGYRARAVPLGDVDGDRCTDLLVGRFPADLPGRYAASAVSGRTGEMLWTVDFPYTDVPYSDVGPRNQVERAGDCDGNGIEDAAVVDDQERLVIVGGAGGEVLRTLPVRVTRMGRFESLGDLDGDGRAELLCYEGHLPRVDADRLGPPVQVVASVDGEILASYPTGEIVVWNVFSPGDVDGDGHLDVAWQSGLTVEVVSALDGRKLHRIQEASAFPGRGD